MVSFFEKLKKGMGIEVEEKEKEKEEKREEVEEVPKIPKPRKLRVFKIEAEPAETRIEKEPEKVEVPELKEEIRREAPEKIEVKKEWPEPEGELAIDVYQTKDSLVIQTAIAGVTPENLDISIERDVLTIKGVRQKPFEENGDYFTRECFWGPFSKEVILPAEVDPNQTEATMKDGILTIRMPKILREKKRVIKVTNNSSKSGFSG